MATSGAARFTPQRATVRADAAVPALARSARGHTDSHLKGVTGAAAINIAALIKDKDWNIS